MKLKQLLESLSSYKLYGSDDIEVKGISEDSRNIKTDYLFVAVTGITVDGHNFVGSAIKNGASVVVGEKFPKGLDIPEKVTYIKVGDTRKILGVLASHFYGKPSSKLKVIGVTGTKGKTTTCHIIYHALKNSGKKVGLISSIKAIIGSEEYDTGFHVTNPDPVSLNNFLAKMVEAKCEYAVIEVSSHGIDQHRISGINFEIGVLTNIAPEHLDYHKTFANYKRIKMSFINSAKRKVIAPKNTKIDILPGKFNNLNVEAALKTLKVLGFSRRKALETLKTFRLPEGRMMTVKNDKDLNIIIDFAHNPSSLEALLTHLNHQKTEGQRLITIFGCASERDESKRPIMGEISTRLSDISIFTAEDPRREDINKILGEIAGRLKSKDVREFNVDDWDLSVDRKTTGQVFFKIPERGEAISFAIQKLARKEDIIAICGKGHEKSMSYNGVEYSWSDKKAVEYALSGRVLEIKR